MNAFLNFGRPAGWRLGVGTLFFLFILALGGGCGKSQSSPGTAASAPAPDTNSTAAGPVATPTTTPTATPPPDRMQPAAPPVSADAGLTQLQLLNRALLGWEIRNHRRPQTFEEFANSANFQIPPPPAGKKYAFSQRGYIILVNSTQ